MNTHKSGQVFGFGTAAIDFRIVTADLGTEYKDKLLANKTEMFGGGATANCLVQIARLGGQAFWLGKLGCDWIGEKILSQLIQEGVDCSKVIRDPEICSPFNVAVYAGEQRRRIGGFLLPNSLNSLTSGDIKGLTSDIDEHDWVMVEIGEISLERVLEFCQLIKLQQAKVMVDVDLDPVRQCGGDLSSLKHIFSHVDILAPNWAAVESLYPDLSAGGLAETLAHEFEVTTVITAGTDGVYHCNPNETFLHQPSLEVKVVDTVGAGDAFHGGVLYALAHHWILEDAIRLGIRCAVVNCQAFGARSGMPTASELGL